MRASLIVSALLALAACADKPEPAKAAPETAPEAATETATPGSTAPSPGAAKLGGALASGTRFELANLSEGCVRTLCVGGPGALEDPANRDLAELCRRAPGVVRRCATDRCTSVWPVADWREGLDALISSFDLDGSDPSNDIPPPACRINLAGWSTGATVVSEALPRALASDPRVPEGRASVDHLVAIAPWTGGPEPLAIDASVAKAWIYRHSKTPADDCSKEYEGGPWLSPKPVCGPTTECWDYDYSLEPALAYLGRRGARGGDEVGHCNIVALVSKIGLDNLARGVEAYAELLPHYSDGQHGGRKHEEPARPDPVEAPAPG